MPGAVSQEPIEFVYRGVDYIATLRADGGRDVRRADGKKINGSKPGFAVGLDRAAADAIRHALAR